MGKSISYQIGPEIFKSKSLLQNRIRKILYDYQDGCSLNTQDFKFMLTILQFHPESELKIGVGVKDIYVKQNPLYKNTRCFWLVRSDNSQTDFSYIECLKETSEHRKFLNACRASIEPYTQEYKKNFFNSLQASEQYFCPYTHERLFYIGSHVDHKAPKTFLRLVNDFINQYSVDINKITIISGSVDNSFQDLFEDKNFENLWVEYHNKHAELQVISQKANLSFTKNA